MSSTNASLKAALAAAMEICPVPSPEQASTNKKFSMDGLVAKYPEEEIREDVEKIARGLGRAGSAPSRVKKYKSIIADIETSGLASIQLKMQEESRIEFDSVKDLRRQSQAAIHELRAEDRSLPQEEAIYTFAYLSPYDHPDSNKLRNAYDKYNDYLYNNVHQQFEFLSSQPLHELESCLYCCQNLNESQERGSNESNSDSSGQGRGDNFFFINNDLYSMCESDDRLEIRAGSSSSASSSSSSVEIMRKWLQSVRRTTENIQCKSMNTPIGSIEWSLGMKAVYVHLGCCEHQIVLLDIRYPSATAHAMSNSLSQSIRNIDASDMFPRQRYFADFQRRRCNVCDVLSARFVVFGDRLASSNPCLFCPQCFYLLHYGPNGDLLYDDFAVFPYWHDIK